MTAPKKPPVSDQFNLFLPYISELPMRDQRDMMERPFFSLAKTKRVKPIDYTSPDGSIHVHVSANPDYGMATIWDADILIYCASVLADMARRGVNDMPRRLNLMPYDLLRAIGRPTTGRAYELLGQALDRLVATTIKTNLRAENRRDATFSWLDGWTQLVDEKTERSRGMTIELSNWFWEGVTMKGGVLSIDRAYFDITGGRERWLYRVARKHAGGAGEGGFAISMPVLFDKSGAEGQYRRFKFEMLKLAEKNELPGYALKIETARGGEPMIRMTRAPGKGVPEVSVVELDKENRQNQNPLLCDIVAAYQAPFKDGGSNGATDAGTALLKRKAEEAATGRDASCDNVSPGKQRDDTTRFIDARKLIRSTVAGLSDAATRGFMTDETIDLLRRECPGWDLYTLHADFERWVAGSPERTPTDWQRAFVGWVRRHHAKNHQHLRG
ncbi:replication initiator protein A [Sphingomonas sp. HH69]